MQLSLESSGDVASFEKKNAALRKARDKEAFQVSRNKEP